MSMLLYSLCATILVLPLGVMPQDSSSSDSSSGSGSAMDIFPLTTLSALTQQQRDNLVTVGFTGMTVDNFMDVGTTFQEATANVINDYINNPIAKRQSMMVSPSDVIVVDVMEIDGVIMIVFVVGSEDIINSAEMVNILRIEGARIAQELEDALNALGISVMVEFTDVIGVAPPPSAESSVPVALALTTIIGIAVAGIVAVVLLAVVILAVAIYSFRKRKHAKTESVSVDYVEVPAEEGNSFSSKWQQMKVNPRGDYEVLPTSFSKESSSSDSDANTHTAL